MPKANINGTLLHYHVNGRGTPIVFIHPPVVNRAVFRYQEVQLADAFQVITFDIRGHGFSPASETPITYPLIAEDMKSLLDYLNIKQAYVCGYSTGGGVALEALLAYPDRFRGAVLIGGMAKPVNWMVRGQLGMANMLAKLNMKTSLALMIAKANADMRETFHNLYYEAIRGDIRNWQQYFEASMMYDYMDRLPRIHSPVLLVYGAKDQRFMNHGRKMYRLLPNATLAQVPGVNHCIPTHGMATLRDLATKWIMQQELRAASAGEAHVDKNLLKKAMDYDLNIPEDLMIENHLIR